MDILFFANNDVIITPVFMTKCLSLTEPAKLSSCGSK